jgi:RHS repeat-associated protein
MTGLTGLAYVRHRDYSPRLGRFIERDPLGFEAGDNNWYRFVGNGPTGMTDPSGRFPIVVIPIAVGCAAMCGCSRKPPPAPREPAAPKSVPWSDTAVAIFTAAGYAVPGSEFPSALEIASDAARALIIKKFKAACEKASAYNTRDAATVCSEYEMVKKKLERH